MDYLVEVVVVVVAGAFPLCDSLKSNSLSFSAEAGSAFINAKNTSFKTFLSTRSSSFSTLKDAGTEDLDSVGCVELT